MQYSLFFKGQHSLSRAENTLAMAYVGTIILTSDRYETDGLTLNVRGPSYLGLTRSISWLLMPWLLTSPGHQQP